MGKPNGKRTRARGTAKPSGRATRALLVDDEPEYLEWVVEFLEARRIKCTLARTLPDALKTLAAQAFDLVLVDMNIPALNGLTPGMRSRTPLVERYPGIAVAAKCRNMGYGAHAVIGYTVHDDDAADQELGKLNCRYVLKARPQALKIVLEKSIAARPPKTRPAK